MSSVSFALKLLVGTVAVPYFLGWLLSSRLVSDDHFHRYLGFENASPPGKAPVGDVFVKNDECDQRLHSLVGRDVLESISVVVHRNGEAESCGQGIIDWNYLRQAVQAFDFCPDIFDKFDVESMLTEVLATMLGGSCKSDLKQPLADGLLGYCDRGPERTPILLDHGHLVPVASSETLPCRFHTREGLRISSLEQLSQLFDASNVEHTCSNDENETTCAVVPELHLYAVPAGRVFMFAPQHVGEIFELPHVHGADGLPVSLEVISLSPRVFDVRNFFSKVESADLVERALKETSDTHRIKRSSTGASGYNIYNKRTSENGFDTHGETSVSVKKRCFEILGFDEYLEGHGDGLQILRYNLTTAYVPHMDWIDDPGRRLKHDYDSSKKGGNRFATILLYMSDLKEGDGGETVFVKGWPAALPQNERVEYRQALRELRESGDANLLERGSWEEEMVAKCRTRLAIRPNSARAVLFYSQLPNGEPDPASLHGGCPVLSGEKWAANLWVWNAPREGFHGAPINELAPESQTSNPTPQPLKITATFRNTGTNPFYDEASLYFNGDQFWAPIGKGDPDSGVNTFAGHKWDVKVDGKIVKSWIIVDADGEKQVFEL